MIADLIRCELTYRERMGLAWQLVWPAIAIDTVWTTLIYLATNDVSANALLVFEISYLLIVAPWLIRRMFERKYPGFRLMTLADGIDSPMGYTESFKVTWLLSWRILIPTLGGLLLLSLILGQIFQIQLSTLVPTAKEAPLFNAIGMSVLENGSGLFLLPLVMPGMFSKQYNGFRLAAQRYTGREPGKGVPAGVKKGRA